MEDFKLIVYSAESNIKDEIYFLNDLLAQGLVQLHLRKPRTPKSVLENLILNIDPRKHSQIVIHSHYDLMDKYALKGIHLTQKYLTKAHPLNLQTVIQTAGVKGFSLSKSVHSVEELREVSAPYNFVTLSPVFDSVSKKGYIGRLDDFLDFKKVARADLKVYGLGGITVDNLNVVKNVGFDGAVVLGALWKSEDPILTYKQMLKILNHLG